jgi:GNAT superfamily N-acetyltransferase
MTMRNDMRIKPITLNDALWRAYIMHLTDASMKQHALADHQPKPDTYHIVAHLLDTVIGHISIRMQLIATPSTAWATKVNITHRDSQSLYETFVQTFYVAEIHRRQGIGQALQRAALQKSQHLGCYQMRSWSSTDKIANYALKIKMGFAIHPATITISSGQEISGVYFIMHHASSAANSVE